MLVFIVNSIGARPVSFTILSNINAGGSPNTSKDGVFKGREGISDHRLRDPLLCGWKKEAQSYQKPL